MAKTNWKYFSQNKIFTTRHHNLEGKGEHVKEVVHVTGASNVTSVDQHGVPELLGVRLVIHSDSVQVHPRLEGQLVENPGELVIVDDGHHSPHLLPELCLVVGFVELHLELLILLLLHVVNDGNAEISVGLSVVEGDLSLPSAVILPIDSVLVLGPPLESHLPVRPALPADGQPGHPGALLHHVAPLLELEGPGLVVVQDGDLHDAGPLVVRPQFGSLSRLYLWSGSGI